MQRLTRFSIAVLIQLAAAAGVFGYEKDVHFSLTYAACVLTGYSHQEALQIASADERMDENDTTTASVTVALDGDSPEAQKRKHWHALGDSREAVLKRLDGLWRRAVQAKSLVFFGQYLHFLQDHFSHRETKGENWRPYGWKIGHAVRAHQPDRVPADRKLAGQMTKATLDAMAQFMAEALKREPKRYDNSVAEKLVAALGGAYSKDSLGYWNEADSYKAPIKLEAAFATMGLMEAHVPHVSRIIKMKFDREGEHIDLGSG